MFTERCKLDVQLPCHIRPANQPGIRQANIER